ncbi:MAG: YdcF family protein [Actinomycetota bacterium]
MKLLLKLVALAVVAIVAYPTWIAFRIWEQTRHDEIHSADAIVVLGAAQYDGDPSPVFEARLDHAAELYGSELAPLIMVSGGRAPGDRFSEAEVGEEYLNAEHGVPYDQVTGETEGTTTLESMQNIREVAVDRGVDSVLLVTDPLHSMRVKRMALDLGFDEAYASWVSYQRLNRSRETKLQELMREVAALLAYELLNR